MRYECIKLKPTGLTIMIVIITFPVQDTLVKIYYNLYLKLLKLSLLDPVEYCGSGSSFPADSAKPVPLAVVSLDSR